MELEQLYHLIESHLDNEICSPQNRMGKLKRMRIPLPEEYGGGIVTGYGYNETIKNLIERVRDQIKMESNKPTLRECFEKWIKLKEGQVRSPSTIGNYKYIARVHILPKLGDKRIDQITPDDIQSYYNSIMHLSKSMSDQSKAILNGIFDRSVRMGEIDRNIMLYKYERSRKEGEKVVLQDEELLDAIMDLDSLKDSKDIRDYLYSCFLCFTALRRGEILGLRWKNIDFERQEIHICNNVTFPCGQNDPDVREPKDESFGTVHLQSELLTRIRPYKGFGNAYVIPFSKEESTKPITRSMFTKMWNRIKKYVSLNGATSHSFRSSYATMMNAHCDRIDPKAIQGALRHKTPNLAIKIYTKENKNKTREAEEEYDKWLKDHLAR